MALKYIRALIDKAHEKGLPVIYTTGVRRGDLWDSGSWAWKNSRSAGGRCQQDRDVESSTATRSSPRSRPGPRDIVIYKQKPSGFFGTNFDELSDAARRATA